MRQALETERKAQSGSNVTVSPSLGCGIGSTCHSGAAAPLGLRLDAGNAYASLVNVASVPVVPMFHAVLNCRGVPR